MRYTLHIRQKDGTLLDEGVDRIPALNLLAQRYIIKGSIVLGFTAPHVYLPNETVTHLGTLHLGKEREA